MSIDRNSSGFPEVDTRRRTTKVNMGVVIGVLLFFAAMIGVAWWFATSRS
jgi:hypothetical protein